jgi:hypothetical protein
MRIDRSATIAGVPLIKVRDLMRRARGFGFGREFIVDKIGTDIADDLVAAGYIEMDQERRSIERDLPYRITLLGSSLANARFLKRIPRQRANVLVADVLRRADEINADDEMIYRVKEIYVFGSYLTDSPDLGDVDLCVTLEFKGEKGCIVKSNLARAKARDREYMPYGQQLYFGEEEVLLRLKAKSPYISLHGDSQREQLDCEFRRIYPIEPVSEISIQAVGSYDKTGVKLLRG